VLGADPDREGGFRGPYDKDVAFHEPLTTVRLYRRGNRTTGDDHYDYDSAPAPNRAGGKAGCPSGLAL
jgi:hypothetical protein